MSSFTRITCSRRGKSIVFITSDISNVLWSLLCSDGSNQQRCFLKLGAPKNFARNSQEITCVGVSFLTLLKEKLRHIWFPVWYDKFLRNSFFTEHLRVAGSLVRTLLFRVRFYFTLLLILFHDLLNYTYAITYAKDTLYYKNKEEIDTIPNYYYHRFNTKNKLINVTILYRTYQGIIIPFASNILTWLCKFLDLFYIFFTWIFNKLII